jgi:hypothetical protein
VPGPHPQRVGPFVLSWHRKTGFTAWCPELTFVHPKSGKITTRSTVSFYVEVTIAGKAAPAGTVVNGYAKGTLVTTGKVNGAGKVKLVVRSKLPKGSSTLKAQLPSSDTVKGSTDSVKVKVVKKK